jgi:hypothetical protein
MKFTSIDMEGSLIPPDTLEEVFSGTAPGQRPQDFGLDKKTALDNDIAACWSEARGYWSAFQRALAKADPGKSTVSITRDLWLIPLLTSLGFSEVTYTPKAAVINGRTYAISHRAGSEDSGFPLHLDGAGNELDKRSPTGRPRISPHTLVQEFLNNSDHLWGAVSNGLRFRILRNSSRLSKPVYLEFNLEQLMVSEQFAEFSLFYRLVHRTRWPVNIASAHECLLEKYYQSGIETGGRIREKLREGVEQAILIFGNGFLSHPLNNDLRERLRNGSLTPTEYYRQLLRLIYRFLFLMVSEQRNLIGPDPGFDFHQKVYNEHYSISRLRGLAGRPLSHSDSHRDMWEGVKQTFRLLANDEDARLLNMQCLDGDLFSAEGIKDLTASCLCNSAFLEAMGRLSYFQENNVQRLINYAFLDVEELGSVYESLLDHYPVIRQEDGATVFEFSQGTERKTTGSYYTRPELVQELIKSGLDPIIEERLSTALSKEDKEKALLGVRVCDPAAGSGHFLLAAARRIAKSLAQIRLGEDQVTPDEYRRAVREVIRTCIYGVDLNPLAVDLCKVALWLEGHNRGMPLTFLDHHVKCGNSLVGVDSLDRLRQGIPEDAFKPVTGDVRESANAPKRLNRRECENINQGSVDFATGERFNTNQKTFSQGLHNVARIPDENTEGVHRKQREYQRIVQSREWETDRIAADLWTSAFFWPLTEQTSAFVPNTSVLIRFLDNAGSVQRSVVEKTATIAQEHRFFHWPLEFPDVFFDGGFDVVLTCPPWRRFHNSKTSDAIDTELETQNEESRTQGTHLAPADAESPMLELFGHYVKRSSRFPLTKSSGPLAYALFTELGFRLIKQTGRCGLIVPTAIATDRSTRTLFLHLLEKDFLVSLYDFENRPGFFDGAMSTLKFCLFTFARKPQKSVLMAFFLSGAEDLTDKNRLITLRKADPSLINPNTKALPIFRNTKDADIVRNIYKGCPVLANETAGSNDWGVSFSGVFQITSDRKLFSKLERQDYLPLYEGKMIHQFDYRWATYDPDKEQFRIVDSVEKMDPDYAITPRYWVPTDEVRSRLHKLNWRHEWVMAFRDVCRATDCRTGIFTVVPLCGTAHPLPLLVTNKNIRPCECLVLLANCNSLVLDYVLRQKFPGHHLLFYILKQLPIIPLDHYSEGDIEFISSRVTRLIYTSRESERFAVDCGFQGNPFKWDDCSRAELRADLDAYYAALYGLTRDELHYILDPQDVYGPDFPGETFRVLKNKEIRQYGEYRTKRLTLEAWDRLFGKGA